MSKKNTMKPNKTALEAAQELLTAKSQKDVADCVIELQKLQEEENKILKSFGCQKTLQGSFSGSQLQASFAITKI